MLVLNWLRALGDEPGCLDALCGRAASSLVALHRLIHAPAQHRLTFLPPPNRLLQAQASRWRSLARA